MCLCCVCLFWWLRASAGAGLVRLTLGLLDVLKRSAPARIINVASTFHYSVPGGIPYEQVHDPPARSAWRHMDLMPGGFYPASKLAVVLFSATLARRLAGTGVVVHSLHPGHVATGTCGLCVHACACSSY